MMKWYNQNIKEELSAYLDDELPKHEKDLLEDKLITSTLLRSDAEAGRKVKERLASLKRLPEDEYFTSRLMEKIKSEKKSDKIFFCNSTICRYQVQPNSKFFEIVRQNKEIDLGVIVIDRISLITTNSVADSVLTKIINQISLLPI